MITIRLYTMFRIVFLFLLVGVIFLCTHVGVLAQGCSDAGVCTINSFKARTQKGDSSNLPLFKNYFKVGLSYGLADHRIQVASPYIEYGRQFNKYIGIDAKINAMSQSGNRIARFNISDIYLNGHYTIIDNLKFTLGVKIPLTRANTKENGLALPMDYQSSLGTFDLIAGIGYFIQNFHIVAAYQQPLVQNNNQFLSALYPDNSLLRTFQSTNQFKRAGDILFRFSYLINIGKGFSITPSVLPIFHIADDKFTDIDGIQQSIAGSKGITLNGNVYLNYEWKEKHNLQLNVGAPFLVRKARPDGLTRKFVISLDYSIRF